MKVLVITNDAFIYKKAELELSDAHTVTSDISDRDISVLIYDCESGIPLPNFNVKTIKLSRENAPSSYPLPLPLGKLSSLIGDDMGTPRLYLSDDGKSAVLDGVRIKLTSHEFSLLALLISGGKNYVSRDRIASEVWDGAGDGLINIYIHYLREKLENGGEKIILSSRKLGYKINDKYLGGAVC